MEPTQQTKTGRGMLPLNSSENDFQNYQCVAVVMVSMSLTMVVVMM
jgi:hypothetical protein